MDGEEAMRKNSKGEGKDYQGIKESEWQFC